MIVTCEDIISIFLDGKPVSGCGLALSLPGHNSLLHIMGNDDGLQFGHFRAMIRIGGKPAQCYAVDVNKRKKEVTCWIASEVGQVRISRRSVTLAKAYLIPPHILQKFAVSLKKEETPYNCSPAIFLDDKKIVYRPLEKSFVGRRLYGSVVTSKTTRRPFVFGELSVTGDACVLLQVWIAVD